MNSRSFKWLLLCLPCLAAVWLLWPHAAPSPVPVKSAPAFALTKPAVAQPAAVVVRSAATSPGLGSGLATGSNAVAAVPAKTNKFALRLTNTAKSLDQLSHDDHAILLANALIDTRDRISFSLPKNLQSAGDPGAYIVQANGTIDANFRAMLAGAGAQIVSYIPNNAYLVRISAGGASAIAGSGMAAAVLPYEPYYKVSSGLLALATAAKPLVPGTMLNLGVFADGADATAAAVEKLGGKILARDRSPFGPILRVLPPKNWTAFAQLPGVQVLEPTSRRQAANDLSRVKMGVSTDTVTNMNYLNLYGSNILVEVNDSGIDMGHPDFTLGGSAGGPAGGGTRVMGDLPISLQDTIGHGTHVAGIIAGNGARSYGVTNIPRGSVTNADFRGKAPLADLFSVGFLGGDPLATSDYYLQTTPALTNALISNNSWVYGGDYDYDLASASYDAAVRDALPFATGSQPVLFVFAAGNDGSGNSDGSGGIEDTVQSPGTAKNVITVGALEQLRNITNIVTDASGNSNAVWKSKTDSSTQVADYSARGNVGIGVEGSFGRFKPDVVAPGTFVVSTRSRQWDQMAYYNPTNYSFTDYTFQVVDTNSLNYYNVSVPGNAVGVVIQVSPNTKSPVPFPPNMPIYVEQADFPDPANNPGAIDFITSNNVVSIPPDGGGTYLQGVLNDGFWFAVGDGTNVSVNYDVSVEIITTNDNGNYFLVLSNLNISIGPDYRYESGTSMATPAVSGVLALMQDFFTNSLHAIPSPALLKAMLINGSRAVGNYKFAITNAPNFQGWGLVNLPNSLPATLTNLVTNPNPPSTPDFFLDQSPTNALATGDSQTFRVTVDPGAISQPLRVTLTWTDPPGDPSAAIKLVNNLDIIVTNLDTKAVYYGNNFATVGNPPFSLAAGTNGPPNLDVVNNVRNIYLASTLSTNYTVTVLGRSVNVNAVTAHPNNVVQDFALVIAAGNGTVSNALTVATSPVVLNEMTSQTVTFVATTNAPLFNQIAGANTPLIGTNTIAPSGTNSTVPTNSLVTVGMTNQWHFYVVTNFTSFANAAFITFFPATLAVPREGVFADSALDATRVEADIDLYVAKESSITNLDPLVISNCINGVGGDAASVGRGGTEFVAYSNSVQGQVYYIGVKSEDHMAALYGFLPVFSAYPFSSLNPDGSQSVYGLTFPVTIPDGSPTHPGVAYVFALALYPMTVDEILVTNQTWHQNFGDLYGTLSHADINVVLNSHDAYGNSYGTLPITYDDTGHGLVPGSQPSDGPGTLVKYRGQEAIGPWILTEVDNAHTQTGVVTNYGLRIKPHQPPEKGITVLIAPHSGFFDYIDVPQGVTNLTLSVTNLSLPATQPPLQVYLRFEGDPSPILYDQTCTVSNGVPPGGSVSVGPFSLPPIQPGRYFFEVFNPSDNPATVYIIAKFDFAATFGTADFLATSQQLLLDDAVTTNSIVITNTDNIFSAAVGVVIDHPRVSDLTLTLLSPAGQRYVLFENRGGNYATNLGHLNITTNFFGTTSAGSGLGDTNVLGPVPTQGTLIIDYDFFTVPDNMDVYYDGVNIFDSGYVNHTGQFVIPYGPGVSTNISIVMDQGGDPNMTLWTYTPQIVNQNYTYFTFTDDTNFAQIPVKFAVPPFDLTDLGTNFTLSNFELATNGNYLAQTNIYDAFGGWLVPTNIAGTGTNIITLTNNQVTVVTDPRNAYDGSNFLALANGTITRVVPTLPERQYTFSFSYRGAGIAGWWRGEGNATDSSDPETNGNNGTLIGRFNFPAGVVGQAFQMEDIGHLYQFAGTNNYVQIPHSKTLDVGTGSGLTVEGWINPTNLYSQGPLVEWLAYAPTNAAITNISIVGGPFLNRATGHYYYLLGATNWTTSELWATEMGGHLATINDANEQNWVFNAFAGYGGTNRNLWIGLNDVSGNFLWTSGQTTPYANWLTGQPANCTGNDHYAAILGATNAQPGLWMLENNNGIVCNTPKTLPYYGVVELEDLPTNGVQFWVSVTNSPATGSQILTSNACLYANLVDISNVVHEIWSAPGLVQSNVYQHVALTYSTNTGVATLYYNGTNVASTNLGVFTPKTTGDVLLGKDMSRLTNNFYAGKMDEMSIYGRSLSDSELAAIYRLSAPSTNVLSTNGILGAIGKFDPTINPALGLAEASVTLGGKTNLLIGANTNWQRVSYTFIATSNSIRFQFTGLQPGILLDDFTVAEAALGNVYYQPEESIEGLVGQSAAGKWTLEILDNRAGDTNSFARLISWQLQFVLQTNNPLPIVLSAETPATNTVPPGQTAYFYVPIPSWAAYATNILVSATSPVDLLFNPTNPPTGSNPGDLTLFANSTGSGIPTGPIPTGFLQTNTPPLTTNYYYLGVRNRGTVPATAVVRVDFDLLTLTNGAPFTATLKTNEAVRYFAFDVSTNNAVEATFQLLKLTGNADLVVSSGTPLPTLANSTYGSFNVTNADENIYVLTNTLPTPLTAGRWYLGVFRRDLGPVTYAALAKELDAGQTTVVNLTNNIPFNFTMGPGADLTNFFQFNASNSLRSFHFEVYGLTGNGDLTVQTNAPGLAPPFYQTSQELGLIPEFVYLRTNSALTNLNGSWFAGVPNRETNTISYSIVVMEDDNGSNSTLAAFPGAVGAAQYTVGGRGSTNIYHVINLNDDGPGSLRYGLNSFTNNATIVFDVAGNIPLESPLIITNSFMTIAGQTAPGNGVTIQNYPTILQGAHDVVMRFLRFRLGDLGTNVFLNTTNVSLGDSLSFTNAFNVIVDHVSASWSTNAVVSVLNSTNITVQWSVISDSLYSTNGLAGTGSLLRYGHGAVSFNHNLYANNYVSSPQIGDNLTVDFVNNVVYNWGLLPGWSLTNDPVRYPQNFTNQLNFAANYYLASTNSQTNYIAFWGGSTNTWIFQTNNFIDVYTNQIVRGANTMFVLRGADTGWAMFTNRYTQFGRPFFLPNPADTNIAVPSATAEEAYQAYEHVLDFAGDHVPAGDQLSGVSVITRDLVDLDLVNDVRTQHGRFISSQTQSDTGGWPALGSLSLVPTDTDQDGLPDYWETTFGLNPTNAADGTNIVAATGYTQLETYLNWLAAPHAFTTNNLPVVVDLYQLAGGAGRLSFFVTNALNGTVQLTNYVDATGFVRSNSLAIFTPTNGYFSTFANPASFDFYVTNNDTVAYFGPVTVNVLVSTTNISDGIIDLPPGTPVVFSKSARALSVSQTFRYTTTNSPGAIIFELYALSGNGDLVLQTNSVPVAPNYFAASTNSGTTPELILVQTNSALTNIGSTILSNLNYQWFFQVLNNETNPITYTVVVRELPTAPNIINLTNGVPFDFSAESGPALTNFYRFTPTNVADSVQFQLYNQSGNGDLVLQTNALPFAPVYSQSSQQPGGNPEIIQVTNGAPVNPGRLYYLGVPNNDPSAITYTILAEEFAVPPNVLNTNTLVTNTVVSGGVNYFLVNVPANADLASNALVSADGPLDIWFSTNLPPTFGAANDALLLGASTAGLSVFGTNITSQIVGATKLVPGKFYYLAVHNNNASAVNYVLQLSFHLVIPPVTAPTVITLPASGVSAFGALLHASVIPNGATSTVYFAYGLTTNYGSFSTTVLLTNSLYSTFPVAIGVTNLLPGNIYHYQAIATNLVGAHYGADLTFTNPPAAPSVITVTATNINATGATLQALVTPNGLPATVSFAYGTTTSYGSLSGTVLLNTSLNTAQPVAVVITNLSPGVVYHFRAIGYNSAGTNFGGDLTFTNLPAAPAVTTAAAGNITATSAQLHAQVNPNGAAATVSFAYGLTTAYGSTSTSTLLGTSLTTIQPVAINVNSLLPGVTYHFQAVGINSAGTGLGQDLTFTTPPAAPTVITQPAANIAADSATLPALVTPNGAAATVYVAYGTTTNYGSVTPATILNNNLNTAQLVSSSVTGLVSGVTYHYRAFASNSAGTNFGGDLTFVTGSQPIAVSIVATNHGYLLSWYAPTNYQFKVQWNGSLLTTNWSVFSGVVTYTGPVTATNGLFTYFDDGTQTGGFTLYRFYRLLVLPVANNQPPVLPLSGSVYRVNPLTTLVVTNTATDANPNAILTYVVSGTYTNQLTIGTNNGIITWTPTLAQVGLTNIITTIVTDNGAIPLSATNTFTVIVNPIPFFSSVTVSIEGVTLKWIGAASNQFQIGVTTNLLSPWTYVPVSAPYLTSPTTNFIYVDTNSVKGNKFYQLRQLP